MKNALKVLPAALAVLLISTPALAQDGGAAMDPKGWIALAAGLGIGIAAFGGALGQGRTAAAALEGIARNPQAASKIQTPMIIGLALIESLVIYALVITFLLQGYVA
mgnify:CR=1 FL=1